MDKAQLHKLQEDFDNKILKLCEEANKLDDKEPGYYGKIANINGKILSLKGLKRHLSEIEISRLPREY